MNCEECEYYHLNREKCLCPFRFECEDGCKLGEKNASKRKKNL